MSHCDVQASGAIELYFYGETPAAERAGIERHLARCEECRRALEELAVIRAALSARPLVASPPEGNWSAFMARLDDSVRRERPVAPVVPMRLPARRRRYVAWAAMAALVALATFSVLFVARPRPATTVATLPPQPAADAVRAADAGDGNAAAFLALSEKHFERSKLVVLGLTARDARDASALDWDHERQLASSLLTDTRLYRLTAEQRGMTALARVMGDLELVLLQTSMSDKPDPDTLEQLQRLIAKRDLVTKMEVVTTAGL